MKKKRISWKVWYKIRNKFDGYLEYSKCEKVKEKIHQSINEKVWNKVSWNVYDKIKFN